MKVMRSRLLLLERDEDELFRDVCMRISGIELVDNDAWLSADGVPTRTAPIGAGKHLALWWPHLQRELRPEFLSGGRIVGRQAGRGVVQWIRSTMIRGSILMAGRWAVSYEPEDVPMKDFVTALWDVLYDDTTNRLVQGGEIGRPTLVGRPVRDFRVGSEALTACRNGSVEFADLRMRLVPEN